MQQKHQLIWCSCLTLTTCPMVFGMCFGFCRTSYYSLNAFYLQFFNILAACCMSRRKEQTTTHGKQLQNYETIQTIIQTHTNAIQTKYQKIIQTHTNAIWTDTKRTNQIYILQANTRIRQTPTSNYQNKSDKQCKRKQIIQTIANKQFKRIPK